MEEKIPGRSRWLRWALLAQSVVLVPLVAGVAGASAANYVSLGDSYTAGPVVPNQIAPLGCLKSDHNYPHLAGMPEGSEGTTSRSFLAHNGRQHCLASKTHPL